MLKLPQIKKMHPFMFVGLENNHNNPAISSIVNSVVNVTGIEFIKIQSVTRKREILYARHLFCYFARKRTKLSLQEIGNILNRDHATVLHSVRTVKDLLTYDREFIEIVPEIENKIKQYERLETT
jgi:chromosomal replication initiator protein